MREELRRGLLYAVLGLTAIMALVFGVSIFVPAIPVTVLALVYLVLISVGWVTYGVMCGSFLLP